MLWLFCFLCQIPGKSSMLHFALQIPYIRYCFLLCRLQHHLKKAKWLLQYIQEYGCYIDLLHCSNDVCVCTFPNDIQTNIKDSAVFSIYQKLIQIRLWLLRSLFAHTARRCLQLSCLLWFRFTFLRAGVIAEREPSLSLEHSMREWMKRQRSLLFAFSLIVFSQLITFHMFTITLCNARRPAVSSIEGQKNLTAVSIVYISLQLKFMFGFFLVLNCT